MIINWTAITIAGLLIILLMGWFAYKKQWIHLFSLLFACGLIGFSIKFIFIMPIFGIIILASGLGILWYIVVKEHVKFAELTAKKIKKKEGERG